MKITHVYLDNETLPARSDALGQERDLAIADLLAENAFRPIAAPQGAGPYRLSLRLEDGRLNIGVFCQNSGYEDSVHLGLPPFKRHIQDYRIICDNFQKTARAGDLHRLEAIDAGRRAVHDEAAEILSEALENKVILDKRTARRLFSLLFVLHMRNEPTF